MILEAKDKLVHILIIKYLRMDNFIREYIDKYIPTNLIFASLQSQFYKCTYLQVYNGYSRNFETSFLIYDANIAYPWINSENEHIIHLILIIYISS